MTDDEDKKSVIERLKFGRDKVQVIMDLVTDKKSFTPEEKEEAQRSLREFKEYLEAECKPSSTIRGEAERTRREKSCYDPVVRKASADLRIKTNSDPRTWHSELYCARDEFTHMLFDLEKSLDTKS